MPAPAAFPSVLSCTGQNLVDANGYVMPQLRGFNLQPVPWSAQSFLDMAAKGVRLIRIAVFWDQLEPTQGNIDTVTYIPALDTTIQRAQAAGIYCWLNFYFSNGNPTAGHLPTWVATRTYSMMSDYTTSGQNATQYLAKRYGDAADPLGAGQYTKAVIGMGINEPPPDAIDTASWQTTTWTEQIQMATWMRAYAPSWIASMAPAWSNSAIIPNAPGSGQTGQPFTGVSTASPGLTNFWVDAHDYFWGTTTPGTPVFDGRTTYGRPLYVSQGGTQIGPDGGFNYPPLVNGAALTETQMSEMFAAWAAPFVDFCAAAGVPLMIGESGFTPSLNTGWAQCITDKNAQWQALGTVIGVLQWDYDVTVSQDPWLAHPGVGGAGADPIGWQIWTDGLLSPPQTSIPQGVAVSPSSYYPGVTGPVTRPLSAFAAVSAPSLTVNAGLAAGAGTAQQPVAGVTAAAGLATGTGTAQPPVPVLAALAGIAAGTGTAQQPVPVITANAGLAAGTGAALQPVPAITVTAGLATGTAAALQPSAAPAAPAGLATAAGGALSPGITITAAAGLATGTGTGQPPAAAVTAPAGLASGTGGALSPAPVIAVNAGLATGTGTAWQPSVQTGSSDTANAGLATGTGTALAPVVALTVAAGLAPGTGTAQPPVPVLTAIAGLATAAGTALQASVSTGGTASASLATGTGAALSPAAALTVTAGLATGTGTAQAPAAVTGANAGLATAAGIAQTPVPAVTASAGLANGTGTAQQPSVSASVTAALATGTGAALPPVPVVTALAGLASAAGAGLNGQRIIPASLAAAAGTAQAPVPVVTAAAGAATGAAAAQPAVYSITVAAGLATGTGTAQTAVISVTVTAGLASGAGQAGNASASVQFTAVPATAAGAALQPTAEAVIGETGTVTWLAGPWPPRWQASPAAPRWRVTMSIFQPIAAISLEEVNITWTSDLDGTRIDPTGQTAGQAALTVQFAFPLSSGIFAAPAEPVTWYAGSWLLGGVAKGYISQCLVGPGGVVTLSAGHRYDVWGQVSGAPEAPAKFAGTLAVY